MAVEYKICVGAALLVGAFAGVLAVAHAQPIERDDAAAAAFAADPTGVLSIGGDNDVVGDGQDRWYTGGLAARYLFTKDATPWLDDARWDGVVASGPRRLELTLGQQVFTPEELGASGPIPDDRPYGGFLYVGATMTALEANTPFLGFDALTEDRIGLQLGAVGGDASLGEAAQESVHSLYDGAEPDGWDNGLENEPGVNLIWTRTYHVYGDLGVGGLQTEMRPMGEIALGTVNTQATLGGELRVGDDLQYDLSRVDNRTGVSGGGFFGPPDGFAWAAFAGTQGRFVAHNVFLDGNVFADGPNDAIDIDKRPFVVDAHVGVSVATETFRLGYALVWRSEEFVEQDEAQIFSTLTLGVNF